jgi:hypothetical protein
MAAGTEPISVKEMIESLQPYICAHTLAGAGGGGFFFCLLKDPTERGFVENLLTSLKVLILLQSLKFTCSFQKIPTQTMNLLNSNNESDELKQ